MGWKEMLKTLLRNQFMPLLVIAQVVFALVVVVNVGSMLYQQMAPVLAPTGVPAGQVVITNMLMAGNTGQPGWSYVRIQEAEQAVRMLPGVEAVSAGMGAPFGADGLAGPVQPTTARGHRTVNADLFSGDNVVRTLGLDAVRGRAFSKDDYLRGGFGEAIMNARVALVSQALARQLFPDGHAVGQSLWLSPDAKTHMEPLRVIGVFSNTLRSNVMEGGQGGMNNVVLTPLMPSNTPVVAFMIRVTPLQRAAVMKGLPAVLATALAFKSKDAVTVRTYESARDSTLHGNVTAAWVLAAVLGTVTVVVLLGIAGLSGFWVQARIHEIGIRRALGARRADILRGYLLENLLVVAVGAVLGVSVGLLGSAWLQLHFELQSPGWIAWLAGALVLLVFGQLAVLGPALRASRVSPVAATRSV